MSYKPKNCVWCGKEFIPKSSRQQACEDDHYFPCPDCGNPVLIKDTYANFMKNSPNGRRCKECRDKAISAARLSYSNDKKLEINNKRKSTCLNKYGVENVMQNSDINKKHKNTVFEKYSVVNVSQLDFVKDKIKSTSMERYGVDHPSKSNVVRENMRTGMVKKYGHEYAQQVPEIREKTIQTNISKYNSENVMQNADVKQKMIQTNMDRYGVPYPVQNGTIREKIKDTCLQKYNCAGAPNIVFQSKMEDEEFKIRYIEFTKNPRDFLLKHNMVGITLEKLHQYLQIDISTISNYCDRYELWDIVDKQYSSMENQVYDFLKELLPDGTDVIRNDRKIIYPMELDLYLPLYSLAIECNPTYTHNSSRGCVSHTDAKSSSYHKNKSKLCMEKGIFLFHIFGYEWTNKRIIIESMLKNLLGLTSNRIYARKCEIKLVSDAESVRFLNENHRQGYVSCSIKIGLFYKSSLVSLMTFSRPRGSIGNKSNYSDNTYELVRFCNVLDTSVTGGASRLLKYFIDNYNPSYIYSFSDIAHTKGGLYQTLGFSKESYSEPNYVWVNSIDDSFLTRVRCQKRFLPKLFNEKDLDIQHQTERQIMESHGYLQVFDSGCIKWTMKCS